MENVNFKIRNYELSDEQNKQIKNKLEFLFKQIPFKSCVSLDFEYKNKVFYGKLKVDFNGKSFFAKDDATTIAPLTAMLCKKVLKQVMKWKKSRTTEEITGIIALDPRIKERLAKPRSYKKAS